MRLTDWILVEVALLLIGLTKNSYTHLHNPILTTGQPFSYRFASQAAASEWQNCVGRTR